MSLSLPAQALKVSSWLFGWNFVSFVIRLLVGLNSGLCPPF